MTKGITRERIVTAALELLDDQGMDALTVRTLASRLDVRPSALYWHVRNKQELLDEMATEVMRRVADALAAVRATDGATTSPPTVACCARSTCSTATGHVSSAAPGSPTRTWFA